MNTHTLCDPWPVDLECCPAAEKADPEQLARWTLVASIMLWRASGMRWGPSCPITVRPCRRSCLDEGPVSWQAGGQSTGGWTPYIDAGGTWRNRGACGCTTDCSCTELCEVYLPGSPIFDVVAVEIDGEVLTRPDPEHAVIGDYRVDAPGMLVRTDGGCWPDCQPMDAPCGAPGTFCVTYRTGLPLDAFAIAAVSEVVCHLLKGCKGKGGGCGCNIPANARRVSRQGVDIDMGDPAELQAGGLLGLPLADAWIRAVNPDGLRSASRVLSPDFRTPRYTAWP